MGIIFLEEKIRGYKVRTIKNASADATIAIATDFNSVIDQLNLVKAKSLNIVGNGIFSIHPIYNQNQIDNYVYELLLKVLTSDKLINKIEVIRTGGQTDVDEAGAKAGIKLNIPTIILAPLCWKYRDIDGKDISNENLFKGRFL